MNWGLVDFAGVGFGVASDEVGRIGHGDGDARDQARRVGAGRARATAGQVVAIAAGNLWLGYVGPA